jgi:hypothetical protein
VSVRWGLNKSVLQAKVITSIEGKPSSTSLEIVSWDPKAEQLVHSILSPGGGGGSGVWTQVGDEWQLKWTSVTPAGTTYAGTSRMHATGKDSSVWKVVDATKNGEKIADIPTVEFKKVALASNIPEEHRKEMDNLVGDWEMEGEVGDAPVTAEYSYRWARQGHCLEYDAVWGEGEMKARCNGLRGWDAVKREMVLTEYWNVGAVNTLRIKPTSPTVWEGTTVGSDPEGRALSGQVRITMKGPDEFVFEATKMVAGDQALPDMQLRFCRR